MDHETASRTEALATAITTFVNRSTAARMLALARAPRKRQKLLRMLAYLADFKPETIVPTNSDAEVRKAVNEYVRRHPALNVFHVISENPALDDRAMPVNAFLDELFQSEFGTLAWLDPEHFAVYGGEDVNSRIVLRA